MLSAICFNLDQSKILLFGKGTCSTNVDFWLLAPLPTIFSQVLLFKSHNCEQMGYAFICVQDLNPLPNEKILDRSKLKQIADNILKGIENEKISAI